ncbi:hypothetical protein BDN71DRAFT_1501513 [Pleurotus eryngii]|uniref:Uncharacterized protein n=1 Tax=Pleurotus eryngii TaxID=5323 RepID=A0A9P6A6V8_PLEER|nr:hypothetical protein BDN71DRAFT_1501513 [Pleurotus eryngii]
MNAFPAGSRVFFWGTNSQVVYGTVVSVSVQSDGTQVLQIKDDSGHTHSLPFVVHSPPRP